MNSARLISVCLFIVGLPLTAQTVSPQKASYDIEEAIEVDFSGGPGGATDWVGIYLPGNTPDGDPGATAWWYTNGTKTSGGNATAGSLVFPAGTLSAGEYSLWFLANDGYEVLAGPVSLTITMSTPPVSWVVPEFRRRHAVSGTEYSGRISAYASDLGFTFSKVSGPEWLTVSGTGELGGTPGAEEVGMNSFVVRASDGEVEKDATLRIEVCGADAEVVRDLKVMSYNAWHGWGQINQGHRKGIESIIRSDADVIGMQESTDNVSGSGVYQPAKVASELGWHYRAGVSGSLGVISRYPLIGEVLTAGVAKGATVRVTDRPRRDVILMNCHLDYQRYGPYAAQLAGATEASVLEEERASQRDEQIAGVMAAMEALLDNADEVPVFLTGDFNAPSHLDWTPATASNHGGVGNVAWPTSTRVLGDGMKDSFREVHPKPEVEAGDTWSPIFKGDEAQDRIDFVYYEGAGVTPVASEVFTTEVEVTVGAWGSATGPALQNTWPSDHAAVVSTFKLASVDVDDDGMCDAFEMRYFGGLTAQTGEEDADGDGATNSEEEVFASDPGDAGSVPKVGFVLDGDPKVAFSFSEAAFSKGLRCERSLDLRLWQPFWSFREDPLLKAELLSVNAEEPGEWMVEVQDEGTRTERFFYRVRVNRIDR